MPNGIPPIISKELFKKVQKRMKSNKHVPAKEKAKINYLLSTNLFCGKCGAPMVGESGYGSKNVMYHYYKCANAKKHKNCDKKTVKKDYIENLVVSFTRRTALKDDVIERIADKVYNLQSEENTIVTALKQNLKEVESGINNMLNAIQMGVCYIINKAEIRGFRKEKI